MKRRGFFGLMLAAPVALFLKPARVPPMGITVVNGRLSQDSIDKIERFKEQHGIDRNKRPVVVDWKGPPIDFEPPHHAMCRCVPVFLNGHS